METNSVNFFQSNNYPEINSTPIVAAWKIKNPQNVGSLIRLIDNVGGDKLILLDDDNQKRESSIKKTAGLSYGHVKVEYMSSDDFFEKTKEGYIVCGVETSEKSTNIFETKLPTSIVLLLGSEAHGLPPQLLQKCHQTVHIPMTGKCKSMNVSHALSVSLFEWLRQQLFTSK